MNLLKIQGFFIVISAMCFIHKSGLWDSCCADTETRQSSSMALPSPPLQALSCLPTLHRRCLLLPTSRGSLPLPACSCTAAKKQLPPNILPIADQQGGQSPLWESAFKRLHGLHHSQRKMRVLLLLLPQSASNKIT